MLNSSAVDVAIGMIFIFLAISLVVSSLVEALASLLKWRSNSLLQGVKDLLNDHAFTGLARNLYNHALVNPREPGNTVSSGKSISMGSKRPAYMNADQFADAMIDIIGLVGDQNQMKQAINGSMSLVSQTKDPQLNQLLMGIVDRTGGDLQKVHQKLASWFDNAMDRVGGAYKRKTQLCSFVIALFIAAALNVSAINIVTTLWRQPTLAKVISSQNDLASMDVSKTLGTLDRLEALNLPIGWKSQNVTHLSGGALPFLALLGGWLIMAIATLFGAPFWFDALQRIIRLKGSGPSPAEKASKTGAEA